jgi:hypothetical protein
MSSSKVLQLGLNCLNKVSFIIILVTSDIYNKIMMNFEQLFFIMSIISMTHLFLLTIITYLFTVHTLLLYII